MMTFRTANIGSIQSNHEWKAWGSDIICLQETRIGKNNHRSATHAIRDAGYDVVLGQVLPGLLHKVGRLHTPCGGTAILGPPSQIKPFLASDDATGLFHTLLATKRVAIPWLQFAQKRKALVFSIYATTGASNDVKIHAENDHLFEDVFTLASQFGSIPVLVSGDFQAPPLSYSAISKAVHFHNWYDRLYTVTPEGDPMRPLTFSNDGLFVGQGEGCTSIDGFLLNQHAFFALENCHVVETFGRQHRPVECTFHWESLDVVGFTLCKTAPLDVEGLKKGPINITAKTGVTPYQEPLHEGWNDAWESRYVSEPEPNAKWQIVNQFCIHELLSRGATWGEGPRERAKQPRFVAKLVCPPQHRNHCAATRYSSRLHKIHRQLDELFLRRTRGFSSDQDRHVFRVTSTKLMLGLKDIRAPFSWPHHDFVTFVHIQRAKSWILEEINQHFLKLKASRIKTWKHRIQASATKGCTYIFQHLKNKLTDEPANLIEDDEGNILYQPDSALAHLNNKWDDIYAANDDKITQAHLPPIDAAALHRVVQKRKPAAAPGLDGWRTCHCLCIFLNQLPGFSGGSKKILKLNCLLASQMPSRSF